MFALKISWDPLPRLWCTLSSLGQTLARVKISGASTPKVGPKSKLKCPTFWIPDLAVKWYRVPYY